MRLIGLAAGALGDLTTTAAASFNQHHPDSADVRYFTYAGAGQHSFLLKPTHAYLEAIGRMPDDVQNDGVVTIASAKRKGLAEPPWPTDHFGEIGYNLNRPDPGDGRQA